MEAINTKQDIGKKGLPREFSESWKVGLGKTSRKRCG
jgi:hypothetical protein